MAETAEKEDLSTIWGALDSWAQTLSPWQQFIVRTVASQRELSDEQVDQAYKLFLVQSGLADGTPIDVAKIAIPASLNRPKDHLVEKLVLDCVDEIVGTNALPDGSRLAFSDGLTVIYGENGAGKTGFCRLLANVCFSRQRPEILGNIYRSDSDEKPNATFRVSIAGEPRPPIHLRSEEGDGALKRITVFDTSVARHHLTHNAPFNFKPVGFDVFPEISRVYRDLEKRLDKDIAARTSANEFPNSFADNKGVVFETVRSLSATTNLAHIRDLAQYGPEQSNRIESIEQEISRLRSQSLPESREMLLQAAKDIADLARTVSSLELSFGAEVAASRRELVERAKLAVSEAAAFGAETFKRAFFNAVGSKEWEIFVQAAHVLARTEGQNYPAETAHCLLCEQSLGSEAVEHINALFRFVEGDVRRTAATAQASVDAEVARLQSLNLEVFSDASRVRAHVHRHDVAAEEETATALASIRRMRDAAILQARAGEVAEQSLEPSGIAERLSGLVGQIEKSVAQAEAEKIAAAIEVLEDEKRVLRHRQVLSKLLPQVEKYVGDAAWVVKAGACKAALNTRPVTDKEKALAQALITHSYRARLAAECRSLDCTVPVELRTKGDRGETVRGLSMPGGHKPDAVLSEGEQKAIALADFLTEVALNPAAAGIVLDDPVTSQDFRRKRKIAERLVLESGKRQVVIFTHDLVFLTQLCAAATTAAVDVLGHWVEQDDEGNPGHVAEGDLPVSSRHYRTTARAGAFLADARSVTGSAREDVLRKGMGALRTTLEETVVYRVFKEVVPRWNDRVIVTALKKVKWDNDRIDEIVALYEELSAFIEGHSHSDESRGPAKVELLETKILQVTTLIAWAKSDRAV